MLVREGPSDRGDVPTSETTTESLPALLLQLGRRYPRRSVVVVSLLVVGGIFEGIGVLSLLPLLTELTSGSEEDVGGIAGVVVDAVRGIGLDPGVGVLLSVVVLGVVLRAVMVLLATRVSGYAAADLATDLRLDLVRALVQARWQHFADRPIGSFSNAVSSEASAAAVVFSGGAALVAGAIQVLMYAVLVALTAGPVVLLALGGGAVLFVSLHRYVRLARTAGFDQTAVLKRLVSRLADALGALKALKAMARERDLENVLQAETRELNDAQRRLVSSTAALPALQEPLIVGLMAGAIYLVIRWVGMPVDELLFMAFLFQRVVTRLGGLQISLQKLVTPQSAYRSIVGAIEQARADVEVDTDTAAPHLRREIRFERVSFSYGDHAVLRETSFSIPANQLTAIIGPSGGGKTTTVDLVVGLLRPSAGEVWVDDVPLGAVSLRSWRSRVGYVPQDVLLLNDTVFANITLGDDRIDEHEVRGALEAAEAWPFVSALPDGMHAVVGERGGRLSGGQRQRLAIARALVHQPELLVLDEATTALDPASEKAICATLRKLTSSLTVLAISHQPAIAQIADQVLEMSPAGVRGGEVSSMPIEAGKGHE